VSLASLSPSFLFLIHLTHFLKHSAYLIPPFSGRMKLMKFPVLFSPPPFPQQFSGSSWRVDHSRWA